MKRLVILFLISMVAFLSSCIQAREPTKSLDETGVSITSTFSTHQKLSPEPARGQETKLPQPTNVVAGIPTTAAQFPNITSVQCVGVLTSPNQEGPYYSPGSPERSSLVDIGMLGTPVLIHGVVFDQYCNPIAGAKVDFWQADINGAYDNNGYTLRGHVLTDENGIYSLETIEPGLYTGRPPHIHVKVFTPDGVERLTTQMYFPGSENSSDVSVSPDLLVEYLGPDELGRVQVQFNFVIQNPK